MLEREVVRLGADAIACILTTTSCFAPRAADDVVAGGAERGIWLSCCHLSWLDYGEGSASPASQAQLTTRKDLLTSHSQLRLPPAVAKLCQRAGIAHIINNAYGVQSAALCAQVG